MVKKAGSIKPENELIQFPDCNSEQLCVRSQEIGETKRAIADLTADRIRQNGTLERLEEKIDRLQFWILAGLVSFGASLTAILGQVLLFLFKRQMK